MKATIYNEENYLSGNPEALDRFSKIYQYNEKIRVKERECYADTIAKYNAFVDKLAVLIKKLGFNSSIECSLMLSYLINNGFLSYNMLFEPEPIDEENELISSFGTTIIKGNGCCRNYVSMHKDLFERLGLAFKSLYCYQGTNVFNRALNSKANHVVSLIEYNGNQYAIDLYNGNRLYHFHTAFVLKEISINSALRLRYKPYYEITQGETDLNGIQEGLGRFLELTKLSIISPYDYDDQMRIETQNRLRREEDTFYHFHEETNTLKKSIADTINSLASD